MFAGRESIQREGNALWCRGVFERQRVYVEQPMFKLGNLSPRAIYSFPKELREQMVGRGS
jgi:hypothetical protein